MKYILFMILGFMLTISCQKKDKEYNLTEKEKLLTSHGWRLSSETYNGVQGSLNNVQLIP